MFRTTLDKLMHVRDEKKAEDGGFTLIELLVVVVIIGILVAIAIPLYLNYEKGASQKSVQSDIRNAVTAVQQCYGDNNNTLPASQSFSGGASTLFTTSACNTAGDKVAVSSGNTVTYTNNGDGTYKVSGTDASGDAYNYQSSTGSITSGS